MSDNVETTAAPPLGGTAITEGLFVRKSSGLVREIGIRDTFGIGAGILVLMGVFSGFAIFMELLPGTDYYIPIIVGAVVSILLGLTYAQLVSTFPRSGGEYIYASRTLVPFLGAMVGGAVLVAVTLNCANTVVQLGQIYVPFTLQAIGSAIGWHGLEHFAVTEAPKQWPSFLVGLALALMFVALCMRPVHVATRAVFWTFIVGMVAFATVLGFAIFTTRTGFQHALKSTSSNADPYHAIIAAGRKAGAPGIIKGSQVFAAIPLGAVLFGGFTFANYAGGEIKRPARTYKIATMAAVAFGLVGGLVSWAALRHLAGLPFMQAQATLAAANPSELTKLTSLLPLQGGLGYALMLSGDPVTKLIMGVGVFAAFFANGLGYFLLISRIVFALSFDRLLPTKMSDVREKSHSPVYAVALAFVGTMLLTALGDFTSLITLARNLILVALSIFVIGSICAAILPWRRKDLYSASPKALGDRWLGVPAITIVASLTALCFAGLVYLVAVKPEYSGGYHWDSILTLGLVCTVGLVLYVISRLTLRRRGIDLDMAMRELPPE
jgi:basic amino acid/polyamine antiporter, APA family